MVEMANRRSRTPALILAGSLALASVSVQAQPASESSQGEGSPKTDAAAQMSPETKKALVTAQKKVQALKREVQKIQQSTLDNNPELQEQKGELQALIKEKIKAAMRAEGASTDEDIKTKEFSIFKKAQKKAMQDPEVQKARKQFRKALLEAMKEENPKAGEKLAQLAEARKAFREKLSNQKSSSAEGQGEDGES